MDIVTATEARANLYRLIDKVTESHAPIYISGKRGKAVLISDEDWRSIQETLYFHSIPGMVQSLREAVAEPLSESIQGSPFDRE